MLPFASAKLFAGIPFTVKSLACTVAGSTPPLTSIMKSVGWLNITPGQEVVTEQPVGVGVTVAVAVAVGVGLAVVVGVGVGVVAVQVSVNCWLSLVGVPGAELPATA